MIYLFMYNGDEGPLELYKRLVRQGKLRNDIHQERVATELDDLLGRFRKYEIDMEDYHVILFHTLIHVI